MKDFGYWRVLVAATDTAADPACAARFARDRQLREMLILRDLGVWSHYVADASNPMHTTIHSDGWGDYPNPSGYSTERGFHTRFETTFVNAHIEAEEVLERVPAPATCDCEHHRSRPHLPRVPAMRRWSRSTNSSARTHSADRTRPGEDFVAARMAAAVAEIRDLVVMAWSASETVEVGFPAVTPAEVEAGTDATTAIFGRGGLER